MMTAKDKVLILGYGEMGHAMEFLLQGRHPLMIWEKFPKPGFASVTLESAVPEADIILFCLPVNPHRDVLLQVLPHLKSGSLCISIAKGLDENGRTAAQIFAESLEPPCYALLYGPMISEEIRAGRVAFAQLGCIDDDTFWRVHALYQGCPFYLEPSRDITGISWSVILKNVYAMAFGMADELKMGDNMRGYLAVAALHELERIVRLKGGQAGSPFHLAGLGDLITTATSEDSHHHELGRMLARGETRDIQGEGVHTLQMVKQHHLFKVEDYPLFHLIDDIVAQPAQTRQRLQRYLQQVYP